MRKRKYDVIFAYGVSPILQAIPGVFLAWCRRKKLAVWIQDLWPDSLEATGYVRHKGLLQVIEKLVAWIYRHTDLLLVQSRAFIAPVARLAQGRRIAYHPNSVDAIFVAPPDLSIQLPAIPALDEGFSIVFAGNIGTAQAVEVIVEAASLLADYPDIRFVVIGQGSRWDWMAEQIRIRGLKNLHLPGRFSISTMPGLLPKASALLVTLADEPTFALTIPNKIQAYMAIGRPILACLNGEGARLIAEAGAGISVPAQDAQGLAAAVLKLYGLSAQQRDAMGDSGRRYFMANFSHEMLIDSLVNHLDEMSRQGREAT